MQNPLTSTFEEASDAWENWHHLSGVEEQLFYQKSIVKWLGLGDRNTNFYMKTCQTRNSRNTIGRLVTSDGRVLTELTDIKVEAVAYYEAFLQDQGYSEDEEVSEEILRGLLDYRCNGHDAASLVRPVQDEEVQEALFSMPANKTPRPNGYPMDFIKRLGQLWERTS